MRQWTLLPLLWDRAMNKIALVTGGSSGIGLQTALALREMGCTVYEISRHERPAEGIFHISADVSDELQVKQAIDQIVEREGRLDILICNAGFGISGAAEFTENEDAKGLLDVNLFGTVNCCRAAIAHMRRQGSGRIICLSSVAAPVAIPFQAWYSVSKAAVSAYAGALRNEVAPFGISVCAVLPGDIRTGFTAARKKSTVGDELYAGRIARSVAVMEHDEQTGMSPAYAGKYLARLAQKKHVKPQYAIGLKYKFFVMLARLLPCTLCSRIVYMLYAR